MWLGEDNLVYSEEEAEDMIMGRKVETIPYIHLDFSTSQATSNYRMTVQPQSSYLTALNGVKMKMQRMKIETDNKNNSKEVWEDVK